MRYGSVCSGIEAASCAWHPLGWQPQWFAEIEKFPSAVLAHRWPGVPNLGDFTAIGAVSAPPPIDLLVGGTPCQSFSVAGLRGGLADDRGNLALEFLRLAERTRARWLVWENVPGVLSSGGGRDFGSILGGMGELGYGFAYRILDAQFFGVPQRRRRVFVVGYLGDWCPPAAVLFERASLRGDSPPRREARKDVAPTLSARTRGGGGLGTDFDLDGGLIQGPEVSPALKARDHKGPSSDGDGDGAPLIAHSLRAEGFDASEDCTGRGTPLVPVSVDLQNVALGGDVSGTLDTTRPGRGGGQAVLMPIPILEPTGRRGKKQSKRDGLGIGEPGDPMFTLKADKQNGGLAFDTTQITSAENRCNPQPGDPCHPLAAGAHPPAIAFQHAGGVRRLTPRECERLQGFPDDYTAIPGAADGPRYKALGNSMAVPVMAWIGRRIAAVLARKAGTA